MASPNKLWRADGMNAHAEELTVRPRGSDSIKKKGKARTMHRVVPNHSVGSVASSSCYMRWKKQSQALQLTQMSAHRPL